MPGPPIRRLTFVWLLLVAATAISFEFARDSGSEGKRWAALAVTAIAFVKIRFVGLEFMALRHAPLALRLAFEAWVILTGGAIAALYWTR